MTSALSATDAVCVCVCVYVCVYGPMPDAEAATTPPTTYTYEQGCPVHTWQQIIAIRVGRIYMCLTSLPDAHI